MASLRQLKGKLYARISYFAPNGQRKEKLIPLTTKQRAKAEKLLPQINEKERLFKSGTIGIDEIEISEPPELQPLIDDFIQYLQRNNRNPKTINLYNLALDSFAEYMTRKNINYLNRQEYPDFLDKMKSLYPNVQTLNIRLRSIRAFINWLAETERIKANPWKIKQLPVQRKRPVYFTDAEMGWILEAAKPNPELYARVYIHWRTGLRLNEFTNSYLDKHFIRTFDPCKHGIERDIPADRETAILYRWLKKNGQYIPGTISKMFLEILRELKLDKTPSGEGRHFHTLRHTFAVRTYYLTRDIYRVKTLLGHSSVKTTEIYANFDLSLLERDFKASEAVLEPSSVMIETEPLTIPEVFIEPVTEGIFASA